LPVIQNGENQEQEQQKIRSHLLRVVDVGRRRVVVARLVVAFAPPRRVVVADGARVPGQAAAEAVPLAVGRLVVRAAALCCVWLFCLVLGRVLTF